MRRILLGSVLLLAACGELNPFAETEWRLVAMGDMVAPDAVVGEATIEFTTDKDVTGWTGCNSYGGMYSIREEEVDFVELGWTEAGCPSDVLFRQEQRMKALLTAVQRYEISDTQLKLHSEGGQVLVFERV